MLRLVEYYKYFYKEIFIDPEVYLISEGKSNNVGNTEKAIVFTEKVTRVFVLSIYKQEHRKYQHSDQNSPSTTFLQIYLQYFILNLIYINKIHIVSALPTTPYSGSYFLNREFWPKTSLF